MWHRLRGRQLEAAKFRRQFPIDRYVVDFACPEARLVIELDGGQHATRIEHDQNRAAVIEACGYVVLRFWNNDIVENLEGVLQEIRTALLLARNR